MLDVLSAAVIEYLLAAFPETRRGRTIMWTFIAGTLMPGAAALAIALI